MSSADPDSNQGTKDISFSTVLRSSNWAIGGCVLWRLFDHLSSKHIVYEVKKKQTETLIRVFHGSLNKKIFVFFCSFWSFVQTNSENCSASSQTNLLRSSLNLFRRKLFHAIRRPGLEQGTYGYHLFYSPPLYQLSYRWLSVGQPLRFFLQCYLIIFHLKPWIRGKENIQKVSESFSWFN